ncbi:Lysosome-associated membrane glycoprotein 3 [Lonchura striata]|uniref:Lysosome-associated membrane glycoprotein 3 n=1 Tax=Lonchura striata TaxID=40157 RepID=A0A218UWC4_9PASE|nr:lysosome-associated membrane glycoprotein 3 [Lonchura striata domestica]OWK57999.1 Lysosome-associated membrane glycoprotein 3 [Lonchura striata domestica]
MGRSARQLISLTLACAFSSCFAEVALGVELSPEATSFHQMATSAQPLSLYRSSPHQSTTAPFPSTGPLQKTSMSHRTTVQTAEQLQAASAAGGLTAGAGAGTASTAPADSPGTAGQATAPATPSLTAAVKNTTSPRVSSTRHGKGPLVTAGAAAVATNTSLKHRTVSTQGEGATTVLAATSTHRAGPSTRSRNQTTATGCPTAMAVTNTTTAHAGTQTAPTSPASTARPSPTPRPSAIPTGTYTVSDGNRTCVKAVMGLQLMARNTEQEQMEYLTVNPNATKISGSCGMVQSELSLTFSGGFVNITFVKQAPSYSVTKIESRIQLSFEGMLYYAALNEKLFTTTLGNSFKCASRQIFVLEKNFQILFVHMQLQAFDIVGDQFGKEEECFPDRNGKVAPIAVCLTILGLFVIVFATFLISRRKPHRGYERI